MNYAEMFLLLEDEYDYQEDQVLSLMWTDAADNGAYTCNEGGRQLYEDGGLCYPTQTMAEISVLTFLNYLDRGHGEQPENRYEYARINKLLSQPAGRSA